MSRGHIITLSTSINKLSIPTTITKGITTYTSYISGSTSTYLRVTSYYRYRCRFENMMGPILGQIAKIITHIEKFVT